MKVLLELDPTTGEAGYRHASDMIARIFGFAAQSAPLAPSTATAASPAAPAAPIPAAAGPTPAPAAMPAAATTIQPPAPAPASVVPNPLPAAAPVASPVPPPPPAPAAAAPADVSPNGVNKAAFAAAVEAYAKVYKPAGTKARFQQLAEHFHQPSWLNVGAIPAAQYDNVLPWFQVQQ